MVKKALGLDLSNMTDDLRKKYKIKDSVKGVVITAVDAEFARRPKSGCRPAIVIVEVAAARRSATAPTCRSASSSSRRTARRPRCCWWSNADGDPRFVALSLQ